MQNHIQLLATVMAEIACPQLMQRFLEDLCAPSELRAMAERWRVVPLISAKLSYRQVHQQTGISLTTIGRVARTFQVADSGYQQAWGVMQQVGQVTMASTNNGDCGEK